MRNHTTNYFDTFIEVADDTKATCGIIPLSKGDKKTIAEMQYELIAKNPYKFTSDDVLFRVFVCKNNIPETEYAKARKQFFSKGQPCFRASPLTKQYGWGIHSDSEGKIAIFGCETEGYKKLLNDKTLKVIKAMKTGKK
jgi:hypothetical protein